MTRSEQRFATPLAERLANRIASEGPLRVADYMQACLQDPEHGYYRRKMAIGRSGDFVTAPEISQVFGELIGLWCVIVWQQMGSPRRLRLIELGPGRGTLMRDGLRAARLVPEFLSALQVELIETNAALEPLQRTALAGMDVPMAWTTELASKVDPVILIANEFLDTLPVAQWVRRNGVWRSRAVGIDNAGAFSFVEGETGPQPSLPAGIRAPVDGDTFESRAPSFVDLAGKQARLGSPCAALFIDYGHVQPGFGDTLQAIAGHRYADPLQAPGQADITAQVDFAAFAAAARACGLAVDGPVPQGEFLGALGAIERASRLMAMNPSQAAQIETSIARLMSPGGMGSRFQAIGLRNENIPPLPALGAVDMGPAAT